MAAASCLKSGCPLFRQCVRGADQYRCQPVEWGRGYFKVLSKNLTAASTIWSNHACFPMNPCGAPSITVSPFLSSNSCMRARNSSAWVLESSFSPVMNQHGGSSLSRWCSGDARRYVRGRCSCDPPRNCRQIFPRSSMAEISRFRGDRK